MYKQSYIYEYILVSSNGMACLSMNWSHVTLLCSDWMEFLVLYEFCWLCVCRLSTWLPALAFACMLFHSPDTPQPNKWSALRTQFSYRIFLRDLFGSSTILSIRIVCAYGILTRTKRFIVRQSLRTRFSIIFRGMVKIGTGAMVCSMFIYRGYYSVFVSFSDSSFAFALTELCYESLT